MLHGFCTYAATANRTLPPSFPKSSYFPRPVRFSPTRLAKPGVLRGGYRDNDDAAGGYAAAHKHRRFT